MLDGLESLSSESNPALHSMPRCLLAPEPRAGLVVSPLVTP